jgi:hypothetical protein
MTKLFVGPLLVLTVVCATRAQDTNTPSAATEDAAAQRDNDLSRTPFSLQAGAASLSHNTPQSLFASARVPPSFGDSSADFRFDKPIISAAVPDPSPAPEPRFVFGGRDDFRWQMAFGFSIVRFRSSLYYATGVGTDTSITYFTNDWFGVEGRVTTSFAPTIYLNEHVKFAGYGFGPKLAWRTQKFEPFVHTILGGVHILPQTALGSANGFEFQVGGGAGYRFNPRLSTRLVVDWVRTRLWGQWQDNAQVAIDAVLHF